MENYTQVCSSCLTKFTYTDINGSTSIKAIHNWLIGLELVLQTE